MKKMLVVLVFCFPLLVSAQVLDTTDMMRVVDSLIGMSYTLIAQEQFEVVAFFD
ncbi:MAG: hypothetical protein H6577_22705 [Lewinellaceae bacterium]|nr:hypothetical protein [Saprospiraceae bacterium]MCB9340946.1 hypothetical protein [Lewinellaceae bacterium]